MSPSVHAVLIPLEITLAPAPQVVALGEDATFHCEATGGTFHWKLSTPGSDNAVLNHDESISERGISSEGRADSVAGTSSYRYTSKLTIAGTVENNNTELFCEVSAFLDSTADSDHVRMTVIGEIAIDMAIICCTC